MVKAKDLINIQKEREKIRYKTFNKIYNIIEKKINLASAGTFYYVWYQIPEFIIGLPLYKIDECKLYIINQLKDSGFDIEEFDNNLLLIKWFPK